MSGDPVPPHVANNIIHLANAEKIAREMGPIEPNDFPHEGYQLEHTQLPEPQDLVKSPPHYNRNGVETWDLIEHVICEYPDPTCAYHIASIHKYSDRAPYKGKFYEDLRKAIQHAKRLEKYLDRIGK